MLWLMVHTGAEYGYPRIYGCCGQCSTQERGMVVPTYMDAVANAPHRNFFGILS